MKPETSLWIEKVNQDVKTDLTGFATSTRYPDMDDDLDINAAREAYKAMTEIKSFVLGKIDSDK